MDPRLGALEMRQTVADIGRDEVRLQYKLPDLSTPKVVIVPSSEAAVSPDQFSFNKETACKYKEYTVVKTNAQGKRQKRLIGIDQFSIQNKIVEAESSGKPGLGGKLRGLVTRNVAVASRPISAVSSATVLKNNPESFTLTFKEKNQLISREFKAESRMECAEIVARIQFLMNLSDGGAGS